MAASKPINLGKLTEFVNFDNLTVLSYGKVKI